MGRKIDDFGVPGQTGGTQGTGPNGLAREGCLLVYHPAVCCVLCAVCCAVCCVLCAVCCVLCAVCCVLCAVCYSGVGRKINDFGDLGQRA